MSVVRQRRCASATSGRARAAGRRRARWPTRRAPEPRRSCAWPGSRDVALRIVQDGDRQAHHELPRPELQHVAPLELDLAPVAVVEGNPPGIPDHHRPVGRAQIAKDVALAPEDDAHVLARHQLVGQHQVVALAAPHTDDVRRRLVARAGRQAVGDVEPDHRPPRISQALLRPSCTRPRSTKAAASTPFTARARAAATPPARRCCPRPRDPCPPT